jgi:hypothetical protein
MGAGWVDRAGFQRWRDSHDAAGIDPNDPVPYPLLETIARTSVLVSSNQRRAVESARRLPLSKPLVTSELLRESPLPIPTWAPVRLPVAVWDALVHSQWGFQILRKIDGSQADRRRADDAIAWLESVAGMSNDIAVVTHGVFRRLLAHRLLERGWQDLSRARSYKCWSVWSLVRRAKTGGND